jgi:hypothetical protein
MTDRQCLAVAGLFYLLAFPLYGGGQFLLQGQHKLIGLGLVGLNSAALIAIGYLIKGIIQRTARTVAGIVFWGRVAEGLVLVSGALAYFAFSGSQAGQDINEAAYHVAMVILSVSGTIFLGWLFKARGVPQILAALGVLGYPALATAMVLERIGQDAISIWFLAFAGIFEILFAFWLIFRGFRPNILSPAR